MTPNHDPATLFQAPPPSAKADIEAGPWRAVDDGPEAMRQLRHPFAIRPERTTSTAGRLRTV